MIAALKAAIGRGSIGDCTINQRGGGTYRGVQLLGVDDTGVIANVGGVTKFIPWTSINEISES